MSLSTELPDQSSLNNPDDWLAVKTDCTKNQKIDLLNIVSLSVELEKIIIVTREHNRLVTDDSNTKQWCGVFTVEQLYLIHQQICQIDQDLDRLYPDQLRPIRGYLSTYFSNDLTKSICDNKLDESQVDLHDNFLCNSLADYLKQAHESLGISLYVDILFNDLNSSDYFEIYSEFNLKRLQDQLDKLKADLSDLNVNKQRVIASEGKSKRVSRVKEDEECVREGNLREFKRKLRKILETYVNEDRVLSSLLKAYAEYYNNLLKPLIDSRELALANLGKYEKKLSNQLKTSKYLNGKSTIDAVKQLEEFISKSKSDIFDLSNDIDQLCIQFKQNVIDLNCSLLENIKKDKLRFSLPKNSQFATFFNLISTERTERIEDEIIDKKLQKYNIQLKYNERIKDKLIEAPNDNDLEKTKLNELKTTIINLKLDINNEEETILKKKLNNLRDGNKTLTNKSFDPTDLIQELGKDFLNELRDTYGIDTSFTIDSEITNNQHDESQDTDSDDESNFFDTFEDPESLLEAETKVKQVKINEINSLKKKILAIGSKKSSLRLSLSKLNLVENKPQEDEPEPQPLAKSISTKKEEDKVQKDLHFENRKKALQRLRDYKLSSKFSKISSSTDSLSSTKSTSTVQIQTQVKQTIKKPYIPKSKQRILPPKGFEQSKAKTNTNQSLIKLNESILEEPTQALHPPPPPPPPLPPTIVSIPPPPPLIPTLFQTPPPPSQFELNQIVKKTRVNNQKVVSDLNENKAQLTEKSNIEFDLNEIKNFKFKKSKSRAQISEPKAQTNQFNSWESLMNEIRTNAGRNLRNVNTNSDENLAINDSKENKRFEFDLPPMSSVGSKLEWDLNLILSQRSKFFNEDDDDDDSSSESSWNASNF